MEEIVGIKRFDVEAIEEGKLEDIKNKLLNSLDKLTCFGYENNSDNKNKAAIKKAIEKIQYIDQLKKFVADIYNTFNNFINYKNNKVFQKNGNKRTSRHEYTNFVVNSDTIGLYNVENT